MPVATQNFNAIENMFKQNKNVLFVVLMLEKQHEWTTTVEQSDGVKIKTIHC